MAAHRPLHGWRKVFMYQRGLDKPFTGGIGSFRLYALIASHLKASSCGRCVVRTYIRSYVRTCVVAPMSWEMVCTFAVYRMLLRDRVRESSEPQFSLDCSFFLLLVRDKEVTTRNGHLPSWLRFSGHLRRFVLNSIFLVSLFFYSSYCCCCSSRPSSCSASLSLFRGSCSAVPFRQISCVGPAVSVGPSGLLDV